MTLLPGGSPGWPVAAMTTSMHRQEMDLLELVSMRMSGWEWTLPWGASTRSSVRQPGPNAHLSVLSVPARGPRAHATSVRQWQ